MYEICDGRKYIKKQTKEEKKKRYTRSIDEYDKQKLVAYDVRASLLVPQKIFSFSVCLRPPVDRFLMKVIN